MSETAQKINPKELENIQAMLAHPAFTDAWFCERLYGDKTSTSTAKFCNKKKGRVSGHRVWRWQKWELEKLELLRLELLNVAGGVPKIETI